MSLTFQASAFLGSVTVKDSCPLINTNSIALVEGNTPSCRILNATTLAFIASSTTLSVPVGITMINALSACIISNSVTTMDLVEVSTGFRQNYSGGATSTNSRTQGGQFIAGDPSTNVALGCTSGNRQLVKFNGNTFAVSLLIVRDNSNDILRSIILKAPGRWLVGTNQGMIFEVDQFGAVIDLFNLRLTTFPLGTGDNTSGSISIPVNQLAYDNNLILADVGAAVLLIDWSTKTILRTVPLQSSSSAPPTLFSTSSSGEILLMGLANATSTYPIFELDMTVAPFTVRGMSYTDTAASVAAVNMNPSGYGWYIDQASPAKIRTFTVSPRATTTRTFTVQSASSGGVNLPARLTLVDDTSGVGTAFVILDTSMQSPAVYRVPTGRTLIEIVKVGLGSLATWDVTRYNT